MAGAFYPKRAGLFYCGFNRRKHTMQISSQVRSRAQVARPTRQAPPGNTAKATRQKVTEAPKQAPPANPLEAFFTGIGELFFGKKTSDLGNDGHRSEHESNHPLADSRRDMIFVGGAGTDLGAAQKESKGLADRLGRDVTLIHNATAIPKVEGGIFGALTQAQGSIDGAQKDMQQVVDDWHSEGHNPAVESVKNEIRQRFAKGDGKVDLMGSSQGNQIIARALRELADDPEMAARMKDVNVVNMMGPTRKPDYPADVRYGHIDLPTDPVTKLLGENVPAEELKDRQNHYDDRAWQLPGLLLNGGWPGHNPVAILGPAQGRNEISQQELDSLGMSWGQLEDHRASHLDEVNRVFGV
jgi:hypothetical protein